MRTKKVFAVAALSIVAIAILILIFLFIRKSYIPFGKRQPPKKTPVTEERGPAKKVPLELVKEMMSQQQESSYNLRQLAQGGIKSITVNGVTRSAKEVDLAITATYADDSTLDGAATFWHRDGDWYLVEVTREPRLPDPPLDTRASELEESDLEVGRQIVAEQQENQVIAVDFVQGKIKSLVVNNVYNEIDSAGRDKSIADITTAYMDGKTVNIFADLLNHEGFWYLVKMRRK